MTLCLALVLVLFVAPVALAAAAAANVYLLGRRLSDPDLPEARVVKFP